MSQNDELRKDRIKNLLKFQLRSFSHAIAFFLTHFRTLGSGLSRSPLWAALKHRNWTNATLVSKLRTAQSAQAHPNRGTYLQVPIR
jgi:hypothetical protein